MWSTGDCLYLYVASGIAVNAAHERIRVSGEPFPSLLAPSGEADARVTYEMESSLNFLSEVTLALDHHYGILLAPDSSVALRKVVIQLADATYDISGSAYIVRLGPRLSIENCYSAFDLILAKHRLSVRK